jgi:hypothetical protein
VYHQHVGGAGQIHLPEPESESFLGRPRFPKANFNALLFVAEGAENRPILLADQGRGGRPAIHN